MRILVVDEIGNAQEHELAHLPRMGERIVIDYGVGGRPVTTHYLRVKDVTYFLDDPPETQARILVTPDSDTEPWPDRG
jgi:hypothetical protein